MGTVVMFDREFDGTEMSCDEIREEARKRRWAGIRLDADEIKRTSVVKVRRLSQKDAYGET